MRNFILTVHASATASFRGPVRRPHDRDPLARRHRLSGAAPVDHRAGAAAGHAAARGRHRQRVRHEPDACAGDVGATPVRGSGRGRPEAHRDGGAAVAGRGQGGFRGAPRAGARGDPPRGGALEGGVRRRARRSRARGGAGEGPRRCPRVDPPRRRIPHQARGDVRQPAAAALPLRGGVALLADPRALRPAAFARMRRRRAS